MTDISKTTKYDSIIEDYLAHVERPDSWNNLYERPYMLSQFPSFHEKTYWILDAVQDFIRNMLWKKVLM